MSLYKDASLAMIPSAYKDGKLYSIRPTDGSGDFTFSRGSNLAATRVDVNGLIEKGRENLLLQSNQFDTTWYNTTSSETGGQIGYDGSNDAWELSISAAAGRLTQLISLGGVQTFSVYAKAGTYNFLDLYAIGNVAHSAYFDLSTGSVGTTFSLIDSSITSVGNGWYKCSITFSDTTLNVRFYPAVADNDLTGTSGSIYIQDAQLEQGLVATDYIETGASTAQAGILEDMPRLDYSGGASCPSLLLEPQRTNYYTNSEYFSGAGWAIGRSSLTYNDATSPEGLSNAVKWQMTSDTGAHYLRQSRTSSDTWSLSIFVKKGNYRYVGLRCAASNAAFDLDTGTFSSGSGYVEPLDNGWYRIGLTETGNGTFQYYGVYYANSDATERNDATGNEYYHIYGAQFEQGSYPTSYIPTYGSSVTRSDESATTASSDLISTQAFTMFFEHKALGVSGTSWAYALEMADGSDEIEFYVNGGSGMNIYLGGNGNYIFGASSNDGYRAGLASKVALSYDGDKLSYFINGSLYNSATGVSFSDVNTYLNLRGSRNIALKQSLVFPTALTDSECIALTTL